MAEQPANLADINRFGDVPVPVEVRIGFRKATVREVMGLEPGNIVLLDKPAGESLDLLIGNFRMASVEVVVIDDKLSVRIMEFDACRPYQAQNSRGTAQT